MKKELKIGVIAAVLAILVILSFVLFKNGNTNYLIVTATFSVIAAIVLFNTLVDERTEESSYKSKLRQILKTYDAILVKSKNIPKIHEKNIIRVESIEDLVDAQMEIRKPIYYFEQTQSCSFVLLDNTEACIYIIKQNPEVVCPLEITLEEIELNYKKEQRKEDLPDELLSEIERTTIVRLNKDKYVKVSPIRKKKKDTEETKKDSEDVKEENKVEKVIPEVKETIEEQKVVEPVEEQVEEITKADNVINENQVEAIEDEKNIEEKVSTSVQEETPASKKEEYNDDDIEILDFDDEEPETNDIVKEDEDKELVEVEAPKEAINTKKSANQNVKRKKRKKKKNK